MSRLLVVEDDPDITTALRLLFGDGSKITVTGSGLDLGIEQRTDVLGKLDGFDQVNVSLDHGRGCFSVLDDQGAEFETAIPEEVLACIRPRICSGVMKTAS